ncbi:MAG TPA: DUF6476 family protein [Acetobacteraceae bacterium]|nr:DUF6476 family protein [Acetobacteraceae bacterium]
MRALKAATIIMGVLIVLGTGALVAVIVKRAGAPAAPGKAEQAALVPSAAPYAARLAAPAGTRITGLAAAGSLLAVGVGEDHVVVLDPATGRTVGTVTLEPR